MINLYLVKCSERNPTPMPSMMNTLIEVATTAGKIALSKKDELEVSRKYSDDRPFDYDILTDADIAVENYIVNHLRMRHGSFEILSEEAYASDEVSGNCFVIDPIDGTINFANGFPLWGVQIACVMGGRVVAAVIHLPEVNRTYSADEEGAYLNGKKILVSSLGLEEGIYSIEGADRIFGRQEMVGRGYYNLRDFYSTSVSFAMVAGGTSVASVYRYRHPWDYVPGEFIVKAAGGVSYNDCESDVHIVANCAEVLEEMKSVFCCDGANDCESDASESKCEGDENKLGKARRHNHIAKAARRVKRGYARMFRKKHLD